jgi:protein tyrosine phosphatase (PTP) superfamily phosphohydrolase (DUF442 family)
MLLRSLNLGPCRAKFKIIFHFDVAPAYAPAIQNYEAPAPQNRIDQNPDVSVYGYFKCGTRFMVLYVVYFLEIQMEAMLNNAWSKKITRNIVT